MQHTTGTSENTFYDTSGYENIPIWNERPDPDAPEDPPEEDTAEIEKTDAPPEVSPPATEEQETLPEDT
ncbi:hypothetical protein LL912_05180 [Niabella sp. CC-SYL272]|uniref:hypothetical protein n=1 Tax=Niabella agricola TaxID=2891571 RepID=UPI001F1758C6|nr:hypothetical protein [Niabella agricola]MCF3108162.1 hypothetical protein [Niabella agricola]